MIHVNCEHCGATLFEEARFCSHCGRPVALRVEAPLAERLAAALGSDYAVLGELGRGGFAVVFSVRDHRLNRYLAVKVMRPELFTAPVARERFRREAELVAQLDHPNVLSVTFSGEAAGISYFAMPRVHGETLQRLLGREQALAIATAARVFKGLADGLAYAHERNVVHRDVKPANILVDKGGDPLLLDFGVAKGLSKDGSTLSFTGAVIGTPEYMSPEQASGSREIDRRSDIYSLGVVGFEMLTGTLPFTGGSVMDIAQKKNSSVAPNVRRFREEIPAAFAESIARCLERDPACRWETAYQASRAV